MATLVNHPHSIQEDSYPSMDSQYSQQHYRPLPASSTPIFTNPFSVTSSAPILEGSIPAYDHSTIPRNGSNMSSHVRRYSNSYGSSIGYPSASTSQSNRHMSSPALFSQPELNHTGMSDSSYRTETVATTSSGTSPTTTSFAPSNAVAAYQQFLSVPGYQPNRSYTASTTSNGDRRLSQPSLPSSSFLGSPIPSSKPRQHSMVNWPITSGMSSSYYSTAGLDANDLDTLEASRGMLAMSQNGYRHHRGSADSGYYPGTHSTHSSISTQDSYMYGNGAADMSSPEHNTYDPLVTRSLPQPAGYVPTHGEDARSMMNRFSSKPPSSSKKNHVCRICGKTFARPSSLTTHTYSHTGQKPFKCEKEGCGKKFNVVSNLRRHYKVHKEKAK